MPSQCESRIKLGSRGRPPCTGNPHMQHVREPHRYLPRYSGRILRARTRQKRPNLGTPAVGPEFDPGLRQPACRECANFYEVKRQIHSRKTRRGRITKLASVLGNPHSQRAENEVKRQITLPVRVEDKARITRQATVHGKPSHAACSGTSQAPTPVFRSHFTSPNANPLPS